ncbi:LptF/LptG family permease [Chryseosolibacter indicus]|uniref:LptF/LptG family permease n=1 Tax=Chryseosolibacter indicus TaxID=2782351 RepID=A0ABS5VMN9_9BACT|nr:LptF/LptG family permease [Chryseosolibacter indicus]MBT1702715.1 LptF/LptG family permease [Chryseosolibacter indicus]
MKLLDKYIIKQFLSTFFFVVLILLSVITVIDMTDKMDKFAKANLKAADILGYYANYLPWIGSLITPITIFIATVYVCARMAGRTEIIAILSSGVSFKRMLLPYFTGAFVVAVISFVLAGWVIPNSNKKKLAFEVQYLKGKFYYDKRNIHIQVAPEIYLYLQSYNNTTNTGYHFSLERFENNKLVEKLTANRIEWDSVKQKWKVRDYTIKKIDRVFEMTSLSKPGGGTISKLDSMERKGSSMDTALVIHPKEFESDYRKYDGMTLNELNDYIETLRSRGSAGVEVYEVEKYSRFASPVAIFILVFMGVIVSSRKSRGGTGVQIALGFVLSFIFILFFTLFRTFAENGQWLPEISVWIPNIVFGVISLVMYKYVPR